ncbi:MAG: FAD-binding oxidoreductase [Bacteroidetes bacterium]|nr:FAD-binding oxidoreductase [Bacteroidota bacterium]
MNKQVDYIIVGQGIAGTILAYQLLSRNFKVILIDQGFEKASSYVAGALINPIVLKRITKTWRADDFVKYNRPFYKQLSLYLGNTFYHDMPFEKLIYSDDEKYFWKLRYNQEDLKKYIAPELSPIKNSTPFSKEFFSGIVKETAWLDIKLLLESFRTHLKNLSCLIDSEFEYDKIIFQEDSIIYKSIKAKKIIFCEGSQLTNNPFFNDIPMSLNKGELITIKSNEIQTKSILKKSIFILPIDKDTYKVGATFEWKWENENPSESKKLWLIKQLTELTKAKFTVINHEAGIRPSTKDRRPAIGLHKNYKTLALFNGLGSRGCFTAPLLAEEFIRFLENKEALDKEVDINRFYD